MFNLISKLTKAFGVSGNEDDVREVIRNEIEQKVDEICVDTLGNLIAVKKGNGKKIMVVAHMDEIGFIATYIDENGFIRFSNVGGVSAYSCIGRKVIFKNGTIGVIYYEEELEEIKNLKFTKMYIDIGVKNKEDAKTKVNIGDVASFMSSAEEQGDVIISKALDNRSGCAVLIKTILNLPKTDNEIYFVFTTQEELGLRGAKTAAFRIIPDLSIAVDVTATGDTPNGRKIEVKCGAGPAIKIKDKSIISHFEVKNLLETQAKKINIPYQYEVLDFGGNDSGAIQLVAGGIPSGAISIPCRYVHTAIEMVNINDLGNAVKLLTQSIIV